MNCDYAQSVVFSGSPQMFRKTFRQISQGRWPLYVQNEFRVKRGKSRAESSENNALNSEFTKSPKRTDSCRQTCTDYQSRPCTPAPNGAQCARPPCPYCTDHAQRIRYNMDARYRTIKAQCTCRSSSPLITCPICSVPSLSTV